MKPRETEFILFSKLLMRSAPSDYIPWFFRCHKQSKAPAIEFGSWKSLRNRLSVQDAMRWMKEGGNIGLAAMRGDPLVNMDVDGLAINRNEVKNTLTVRSRSRTGLHAFYFSKEQIPNIPTDNNGEVRSQNQYVVAAGSYVPTDPDTVPESERGNAGFYTVENVRSPAWITYKDLPRLFREQQEKTQNIEIREPLPFVPKKAKEQRSAVFEIEAVDVVMKEGGKTQPTARWASLFHGSTTDANMSLSDQGLLQCWRHNVSHNGLQALVVLSGYMSCLQAGTPHKGGAGSSQIIGDDGAIFHAWLYAKKYGYIPVDDRVPVRALHYIAQKHGVYKPETNEILPTEVYNKVLEIIEEEY